MIFEVIKIKDVKTETGDLIRLVRKKQGLTQEQLAEILDISRITIQNLESGKNVTLDTLLKVFQHFDLLERFHHYIGEEIKNNNYDSLY